MVTKPSDLYEYQSLARNRADLLRCLHQLGEEGLISYAENVGFTVFNDKAADENNHQLFQDFPYIDPPQTETNEEERTESSDDEPAKAGFYRLIERRQLSENEQRIKTTLPEWYSDQQTPPLDLDSVESANVPAPELHPLLAWSRLWPLLKAILSENHYSRQVDINQLVKRLAHAEILYRLPKQSRRRWSVNLHVIIDYDSRLFPFHQDFKRLARQLEKLRGDVGLSIRIIQGKPHQLLAENRHTEDLQASWHCPQAGEPLLILSDLGIYDTQQSRCSDWRYFLQSIKNSGCNVIALMPVPQENIGTQVADYVQCISWDRQQPELSELKRIEQSAAGQAQVIAKDQATAKQLLIMLALAIRVEPALLRATRYLLPASEANVASEAYAWLHEDVVPSEIGFHFRQEVIADYIAAFQREVTTDMQVAMFRLIYGHHQHYFPTLRYEEIDHFRQYTTVAVGQAGELADVHLRGLCKALYQHSDHHGLRQWADGYLQRQTLQTRSDNRVPAAIWAKRLKEVDDKGYFELPDGLSIEQVSPFLNNEQVERDLTLYQRARTLTLKPKHNATNNFSDGLSAMLSLNVSHQYLINRAVEQENKQSLRVLDLNTELDSIALLDIDQQQLETEQELFIIEYMSKPHWAESIGRNKHGLYAIPRLSKSETEYYWHPPESIRSGTGFWYTTIPRSLPAKPDWASSIGRDQYGLFAEITYQNITQRLRWINPGTFMMGSPEKEIDRMADRETLHEVTLTEGHWLADTTCTQALWEAVTGDNPSRLNKGAMYPVETVSWEDVNKFIQKLNIKIPGLDVRLPTEAEWEFACRAGTQTPFSFGENISTEQVNYDGSYPYTGGEKGQYRGKTVEVTALPNNNWGLYQMHGNVWEWCADWYAPYSTEVKTNPGGPTTGASRVFRGGSWIDNGRYVRSAYRLRLDPSNRDGDTGFRLARGPKQEKPAGE